MRFLFVVCAVPVCLLLSSCQSSSPVQPLSPSEQRAAIPWWRQMNDPALNQDVAAALATNPDLRVVALRVQRADAVVAGARASLLPRVNLGFGYQEGRQRNIDFGPFDLAPWESSARLSWEPDLTGKLRAARESASESRKAAMWDYHLARLLLASRVASVRLNLYRFNSELSDLMGSRSATEKTLGYLEEQFRAGLIAGAVVDRQKAEREKLVRQELDLQRLRDLTVIQLRTLRGGSVPKSTRRSEFPNPDRLATSPLNKLLESHPKLLASAARVRSAFRLEQSAKLDLLPSFRVGGLVGGGQKNLSGRFLQWTAQAGPSLDLPIYDPGRLAKVKLQKAEAKIAAAEYRGAVLAILEDIDTARVNLRSRDAQLAAVVRETEAWARNRKNAGEQFAAGIISQIELLETESRWLDAKRSLASLRQAKLNARIDLIKATGGGRL